LHGGLPASSKIHPVQNRIATDLAIDDLFLILTLFGIEFEPDFLETVGALNLQIVSLTVHENPLCQKRIFPIRSAPFASALFPGERNGSGYGRRLSTAASAARAGDRVGESWN
jgi:hypothetical protein